MAETICMVGGFEQLCWRCAYDGLSGSVGISCILHPKAHVLSSCAAVAMRAKKEGCVYRC